MTDFLHASGITSGHRSDSKPRNKTTRRVPHERRRLTLGHVDRPVGDTKVLPSDNTGLISFLKNTNVADIVKGPKRKLSFSSVTEERGQDSFDEKPTTGDDHARVKEELNRLGVGVCCKKGMKPESPNQDSFSIVYAGDDFLLSGVYDGHGACGHHVSHFVKDTLPKLFLNDPNRVKNPCLAFADSFSRCQKLIEHAERTQNLQSGMSGSTCTMVYQPLQRDSKGQRKACIAHVGDSRTVMISRDQRTGAYTGRSLTEDHKPSLPLEKKRIEENGGRVIFDGFYNHRVFARGQMYPGLNMSRAFGDTVAHKEAGLCAVPEVQEIQINAEDIGMLICTDGVWEFVTAEDAAKQVMDKYKRVAHAQAACEELCRTSWDAWMEDSEGEISDDITGIFVHFDKLFR